MINKYSIETVHACLCSILQITHLLEIFIFQFSLVHSKILIEKVYLSILI